MLFSEKSFVPRECNPARRGLHVAPGGALTLAGKPFRGFGVNYFGAFAHTWQSDAAQPPYEEAFGRLREYGVDLIRMPFCGYWTDYYEAFERDPETMLRRLDRVVEAAQRARVGIIASRFWHVAALPTWLGEHVSAMGDPLSRTTRCALAYTAAIVSRYADSPAVWAWEIGNEYNLSADLCDIAHWNWLPDRLPGTPSGLDYYTSDEMIAFFRAVGARIRALDGWRMIESGNGEMRPWAKASAEAARRMDRAAHAWTVDWTGNTRADFDEMNARMTPDPLDGVCFHLQQGTGDGTCRYVEEMAPFGERIPQRAYFRAYREAAAAAGKTCLFGEMGDYMDLNGAPEIEGHFRALLGDVAAAGIPLALTWQFQDFTETGNDGMKLRCLGETNRRLRADGLHDADAAWK